MQRRGDQAAAGAAHRVAQGDGTAVDVHAIEVGLVHGGPRQHHGSEGLVDLDDVDIADLHAGAVQYTLCRLHRAIQVVVGLSAHQGLRHDAGPRPQSEGFGLIAVHQQHRRGAVGNLRGRTCGVNTFRDNGFQVTQ
ncbi:Uncharacterised protein [Mycobacteroides abscessus subsp. massiliense]|nr:Uncharacterised protein [Mycobacteroides abscessus subsp. massiliense]